MMIVLAILPREGITGQTVTPRRSTYPAAELTTQMPA